MSHTLGGTGVPGFPCNVAFGAPVGVSSFAGGYLQDQGRILRPWSFLHLGGP